MPYRDDKLADRCYQEAQARADKCPKLESTPTTGEEPPPYRIGNFPSELWNWSPAHLSQGSLDHLYKRWEKSDG